MGPKARIGMSSPHISFPDLGLAEMGFVADVIGRGPAFATEGGLRSDRAEGYRRMLFGTDHPFFPPLEGSNGEGQWQSVVDNLQAIDSVKGWGEGEKEAVKGLNAVALFSLGDEFSQ